jgi:hypothetical protein
MAALSKKRFSSVGEMVAELAREVRCDCGGMIPIHRDIVLQKHITCPNCGEVYENNSYDPATARKRAKKIRRPENCCYEFSEGIYPCLKHNGSCERECNFRTDQTYSYMFGECGTCSEPLSADGFCKFCDD